MASRNLDDLLPIVKRVCLAHDKSCKLEGIDLVTFGTYRSKEEQNELYSRGRTKPGAIITNAKGGQSLHQYRIACDVVPVVGGKAIWNAEHPYWETVGKLGMALGFDWGGDWKFQDKPHFQLTGSLTIGIIQTLDEAELNSYLTGYLIDMGLMKSIEIAERG